MKIIIYDPLFSEFGHFYRYSRFICSMLSSLSFVDKIIVFSESNKLKDLEEIDPNKIVVRKIDSLVSNLQTNSIQSSTFKKVKLYFQAYKNYTKILDKVDEINADYVFFLSQGQMPFWLALKRVKTKTIISSISIKWLYKDSISDWVNNFFFARALKSARKVLFTEEIYNNKAKECGILSGFVFPDRFLSQRETTVKKKRDGVIKLVTLGTIAKGKSPESFIREFLSIKSYVRGKFFYTIAGKDIDDSMKSFDSEMINFPEIKFLNTYLSGEEFNLLLYDADFVVIPYSEEYTRYATSGIMWDCFQRNIPIICPDIDLFRNYIEKYRIGYIYKSGELEETLKLIVNEIERFDGELAGNFYNLISDFDEATLIKRSDKIFYE